MPAPLEYLTEHAQQAYPFKDGCSRLGLSHVDTEYYIPDDLILDLMFVITSGTGRRVCVTGIARFQAEDESFKYSVQFQVYSIVGGAPVLLDTVSAIFDTLTPFETARFSQEPYHVKLVPGPGISLLVDIAGYIFPGLDESATAELESSTIVLPFQYVESIEFLNFDEVDPIDTITSGEFSIQSGANITMNLVDNKLDLSVLVGTGEGLYDGCTTETGVIRKLNGVGPGDNGDIGFFGDQCFNILKGQTSLEIEHTCAPKCDEDQIAAAAYYINRLRDAIIQAGELVVAKRTELIARMTEYQTKIDLLETPKPPFMQVNFSKTGNSAVDYISFAAIVNNPNNAVLNGSMVVSIGIPTFSLVAETAYVSDADTKQTAVGLGFAARNIPCLSYVLDEFVISGPHNPAVVNRGATFLFNETATVDVLHPSSCFAYEMIQPSKLHYNIDINIVWNDALAKYKYYFTVEFLDNSISEISSSRSTNFVFNFPLGITYVADTLVLSRNNVKTSLANAFTNKVSFSNQTINYAHKAILTFEAISALTIGYYTTNHHFTVVPGHTYKIYIDSGEGNVYHSTFVASGTSKTINTDIWQTPQLEDQAGIFDDILPFTVLPGGPGSNVTTFNVLIGHTYGLYASTSGGPYLYYTSIGPVIAISFAISQVNTIAYLLRDTVPSSYLILDSDSSAPLLTNYTYTSSATTLSPAASCTASFVTS